MMVVCVHTTHAIFHRVLPTTTTTTTNAGPTPMPMPIMINQHPSYSSAWRPVRLAPSQEVSQPCSIKLENILEDSLSRHTLKIIKGPCWICPSFFSDANDHRHHCGFGQLCTQQQQTPTTTPREVEASQPAWYNNSQTTTTNTTTTTCSDHGDFHQVSAGLQITHVPLAS